MKPFPEWLWRALDAGGEGLVVLAVRLGAMGDILRTLPAVRALRRGLPRACVVWAVDDRWEALLRDHPDVSRRVVVPRRGLDADRARPWRWLRVGGALRRLRAELRGSGARLALDFHGNLRSGVVVRLSGAPVRLGYGGHQQKEGNRWFTTHRVAPGPRRRSRIERNFDLVRALGISTDPWPGTGLTLGRDLERSVHERLSASLGTGGEFGVVVPGASARQAYKAPPIPLLVAAARAMAEAGVTPVVVHGPGEEPRAREVVEASAGLARLAPPTSLPELAALLRLARLVVSGDSGPLHLACAVGKPVVALYGPTDPVVNAPWGVPHRVVAPPGVVYRGVKSWDRRHGSFAAIPPQAVAGAVSELLAERHAGSPRRPQPLSG